MDKGVTYALGEQWLQNNCTKCYCVDGKTMCADLPCPPINCKFMSKVPGKCCPVCVGKRRFTKICILLHHSVFEYCTFLLMIKEIGSSASYDLQFLCMCNSFFPLKNQYKKK